MYKLLVMYPMPESVEEFRKYYISTHLPLAATLPGLRGSRYSFDVAGVPDTSPYYCIWEGEFDDEASMANALQSDIGQKVAADLENYATGGAVLVHCNPTEINLA